MGWSHGGFITLAHPVPRRTSVQGRRGDRAGDESRLPALVQGPGYQRDYAAEEGIQGLPFEKPRRSTSSARRVFHVENLKVPMLVHVATNDCDVNFVEDQQMVYTLRALKPDLAETKIYVDPAAGGLRRCGHTFSRRVDPKTLERDDSPEQIDSWNRTWAFFEWNLRPYEDRSKPMPPVQTGLVRH